MPGCASPLLGTDERPLHHLQKLHLSEASRAVTAPCLQARAAAGGAERCGGCSCSLGVEGSMLHLFVRWTAGCCAGWYGCDVLIANGQVLPRSRREAPQCKHTVAPGSRRQLSLVVAQGKVLRRRPCGCGCQVGSGRQSMRGPVTQSSRGVCLYAVVVL